MANDLKQIDINLECGYLAYYETGKRQEIKVNPCKCGSTDLVLVKSTLCRSFWDCKIICKSCNEIVEGEGDLEVIAKWNG